MNPRMNRYIQHTLTPPSVQQIGNGLKVFNQKLMEHGTEVDSVTVSRKVKFDRKGHLVKFGRNYVEYVEITTRRGPVEWNYLKLSVITFK